VNISSPSRNFAVAAASAVVSGALCWVFLHHFHLDGADFGWSYRAAHALLSGQNPYLNTPPGAVPYPLPAALVALPLTPFPANIAAAIFFGLSSGLLALGLIRESPQRLYIFFAFPYWAALIEAQWAPLIMCAAFFPLAMAFCIAKPHTGAPIALTRLSRTGLIAAAVLLLGSFILRPHWPFEWLPQIHEYRHFIPFLVLPGPLLALALWRWRDRDAWLLFLACLLPERWFYDTFVLWLIPKTRRSIMATVATSWMAGIWRWYHPPQSMHQVGLWCVLGSYIPMLAIVLFRPQPKVKLDQPST